VERDLVERERRLKLDQLPVGVVGQEKTGRSTAA
jgi:hypothetical protein